MIETLERICEDIRTLEMKMYNIEDDLYHIRLELESNIKRLKKEKTK